MPLDKRIDPWGRDMEKDTVDNPYVAAHQLRNLVFLSIISHRGYFPHSESMGGLPSILI